MSRNRHVATVAAMPLSLVNVAKSQVIIKTQKSVIDEGQVIRVPRGFLQISGREILPGCYMAGKSI